MNGFKSFDPKEAFVFVCMPSRGTMDMVSHISMSRTMLAFKDAGIGIMEAVGGNGMPGPVREQFIHQAMTTKCTHILFVDSDVGWNEETPIRLLRSGFDFCAAICPQRRDNGDFCFLSLPGDPKIHPVNGFIEVEAVGFGMVSLKRSAVEKMLDHYRKTLTYLSDGDDTERVGLFLEYIEHGRRWGEDYAISRRWRAIGGQIWIDPQAPMMHVGRKAWTAKVADMLTSEKVA